MSKFMMRRYVFSLVLLFNPLVTQAQSNWEEGAIQVITAYTNNTEDCSLLFNKEMGYREIIHISKRKYNQPIEWKFIYTLGIDNETSMYVDIHAIYCKQLNSDMEFELIADQYDHPDSGSPELYYYKNCSNDKSLFDNDLVDVQFTRTLGGNTTVIIYDFGNNKAVIFSNE